LFCCWFLCSALPFLSSPPPRCILVIRQFSRWRAIGGGGCSLVWAHWALVVGCHLSVLICSSLTISTHNPPCEQWLAAVGGGCWVVVRLWCGCGVHSCWHAGVHSCWHAGVLGCPSLASEWAGAPPHCHSCTHDPPCIAIVIPPMIHPTSSCS
jgi:hypothetical protein